MLEFYDCLVNFLCVIYEVNDVSKLLKYVYELIPKPYMAINGRGSNLYTERIDKLYTYTTERKLKH